MSSFVFQNEFDVPFTVKAGQIGEFLVVSLFTGLLTDPNACRQNSIV